MHYIHHYASPLGEILLSADEVGLTGLWFVGQTYFALGLSGKPIEKDLPVFRETKRWLDLYFSGEVPDFQPPLHFVGTEFQKTVWAQLCAIPYGETVTYGEIAKKCGCRSAQAVGGAVGKNPISILVPCYRVVGANGSLTGYAGGLERKIALLKLENQKERA